MNWLAFHALCLLSLSMCAMGEPSFTVIVGDLVSTAEEQYLSVTLDAAQVVGAPFWDTPVEPFDFNQTRLINLATALSPAVLRIGGTTADQVYYDMSDDPVSTPPSPYSYVMTKEQWDNVGWFTNEVGFQLLFGVNGGPGPRASSNATADILHNLDSMLAEMSGEELLNILTSGTVEELSSRGFFVGAPWSPDNAEVLFDYTYSQGDTFNMRGWELGNEPNLWLFNYPHYAVTGQQLARDFGTFYDTLAQYVEEPSVVGPDVACQIPIAGHIYHGFIRNFLETLYDEVFGDSPKTLEAISWHWYPLVSDRCPNLPIDPWEPTLERNLELKTLNRSNYTATFIAEYRDTYFPDSQMFVGETGGASCGGQPGVSDRFSDTFWWIDQLGYLALFDNTLQARQTLTGSNYGLIDEATLVPYPDYWGSYVWSTLIGPQAFVTTVSGSSNEPHLRAYARCVGAKATSANTTIAYSEGTPVFVLLNLLSEKVAVDFSDDLLQSDRDQYVLTAPDDNLGSYNVQLNGFLLQEDQDGVPPTLTPETQVGDGESIFLPAYSISFIVFKDVQWQECL